MKKEVVLVVYLVVLSLVIVSVQNITGNLTNLNPGDLKEQAIGTLAKEITIPENLKLPAKIIFGINEDMPFSRFVVYLMLWLLIFLIIFQVVKIMPFFKKGIIKLIAALAISILAANLHGIETVTNLYYDFSISKLIDATSPGAFFFAIILILVVYYLASKIISKIATGFEVGSVESSAAEAGAGYGILRTISNVFKRTKQNQ